MNAVDHGPAEGSAAGSASVASASHLSFAPLATDGKQPSTTSPLRPRPPVASRAPEDDAALVVRSAAGDRAAFEELVRRTARLVYARLYLEVSDPRRAEDLVQETYLVAWRSIGQVTDPSGFRTWLLSIAQAVRIDAGRREGRQKRSGRQHPGDPSAALSGVPDPSPQPPEMAERNEQAQQVLKLLRNLPEEYRQVLTLRYLGGADYETIGRQLGLSNGSLRGLLNRGMTKLRENWKAAES